jgi:hypothetical protein
VGPGASGPDPDRDRYASGRVGWGSASESIQRLSRLIFEAYFKPCSYGFRPNRRAQDAIAEIHHFASESINYRWVFETDIKA